jgi:S-DNA-T family DNA segregation ATPase FtsK/SpoIIIE
MKLNVLRNIVDVSTFGYEEFSHEFSESFLSSSEGTLGLEWFISNGKVKKYLFTQNESLELEVQPKIMIPSKAKEISCYTLGSFKPSCFPFRMKLKENVLAAIMKYIDKTITDEQILIQILLKKIQGDDWRIDSAGQYHNYLNGIEMPSNNKVVQSLQYRILEFLQNKDEFLGNNPTIEGADQKFQEEGYETYVRFAIYGGRKETRDKLAAKVKLGFSVMNYSNSWIMNKSINKNGFMNSINLRKFPLMPSGLILCVSELLPLFSSGEEMKVDTPIIEENIETVESSNIYEIFPRGEKLIREDDIDVKKRFDKAFKKLRLIGDQGIKIKSIQHGSTIRKITFTLPEGLRLSQLQKASQDIQTELALSNISIEQGKEASTVAMILPQDKREKVFVRDCLETVEFQKFIKDSELPFVVGVDTLGETLYCDLVSVKHLLIAGTTGSGKSVFLNCLLAIMLMLRKPSELQMLLIDPKQVELAGYKKYPHVIDVITDSFEAMLALVAIVEKMEARYTLLAKKGYKNIQQYNKNEKEKLPYIVVVIDELADLIMTNPQVEKSIVLLAQKARACGIHLIIATQKPLATVVTSLIKANIASRICFTCADGTSYRVALDETPKVQLLGKGDGLMKFEGMQGLERFQSALVGRDDDEQDKIIEQLSGYWKGNFKKEALNLDGVEVEDEEIVKLKRVILESGETRVTELMKILKVRSEKISELMGSLVESGWLVKHKSKAKGYELVLSDEDKKKYLDALKK